MLCNCLFKDRVKGELSLWRLDSGGGTSHTVISEKPSPLSVSEEADSAWQQETTASIAWSMSPVHTFGPYPSSWYHKVQKMASSLFEGQSRTRGWEPQGHVIVDAGNMEQESELPDSDPNFSY